MSPGMGSRCGLGTKHDLNDAGPVTQIDENDAAMIAATMDPTGENDFIADLGVHHLAAAMAAAQGSHSIELDTLRAHQDSRASGLISKSIRALEIVESTEHHDTARRAGEASEPKNRFEIGRLDSNSTDHCQSTECTEAAV
jgi:hypothetical protein